MNACVTTIDAMYLPSAWRVTAEGVALLFDNEASANAQVFELRRAGYTAKVTPLHEPAPRTLTRIDDEAYRRLKYA